MLKADRGERRRSPRSLLTPSFQQRYCPSCDAAITGADIERGRCSQCDTNLTLWDIFQSVLRRTAQLRRKK